MKVKFIHPESDGEWIEIFNTKKEFWDKFEEYNSDGCLNYEILEE